METENIFKLKKRKIILIIVLLFITFIIYFLYAGTKTFCKAPIEGGCPEGGLHIFLGYLLKIFALPVVILINQKTYSNYYLIAVIFTILLEILYFYIILSLIYLFRKSS